MVVVPVKGMLPGCALLPPNVPLRVERLSATLARALPTMSNAAPRHLVVVVETAVGLRIVPVLPWSTNAQVQRVSNVVFLKVLVGVEAMVNTPRRRFQRLVHAKRKQSMVPERLSRGTQVLSARSFAPGIAHVREAVIIAVVWRPI